MSLLSNCKKELHSQKCSIHRFIFIHFLLNIDLVSNLEIGFYKYPLDTKLELSPRLTKPSKSPLAPGEQVRQFAILPSPLNQAEKEAIIAGFGAIFVHGELVYTDIFKKTRTTRVCLYSTGDDFSDGMLAYYHEGNDAD